MKILKLIIIVTSFISFINTESYSDDKIKFGTVSDEEMDMTVYEHDSSANAVILYNMGKFDKRDYKFTRHVRVKILNKSGLSWGNWVFNTRSSSNFKVYVFNKIGDEIKRDKIDQSSIYKEEVVDDFYIYKVFAENVKVGSIIDIEYSFLGFPFEWRFQDLIPTKHSELIIEDSDFFVFEKSHYGFEPIQTIGPNHWKAENMPAFQIEPYLSHYSNYLSKFEFEMTKISVPGWYYREFSTSWEKIGERLTEFDRFGAAMRQMGYLNGMAKELKDSDLPVIEKINIAYQYIKDNIKWNGSNSIYVSGSYRNNFSNDHNGNSAEVNLALVSLLNKADINAYPVVLSTRDNGLLMSFRPSLSKLNYVVCYVKFGELELLLDATQEELVPGILPKKCLNGKGWLVDKSYGFWVDLLGSNKLKSKQYVQIAMNDEGNFEATVRNDNYDYAYLNWVDDVKEHDNGKTYEAHLKDEFPDIDILEYIIKKDNKKALNSSESLVIDITNQVDDLGDEYIINPHVMAKYASNPFQSENRKYPVDINNIIDESTTVVVQIPQGYTAKDIPESINIKGLNDALSFVFLSQVVGSNVNINCKIEVTRTVFTEDEYHIVKSFFSEISKKFNESINLQKI